MALSDYLVFRYNFYDNAANKVVLDSSGNGYNGTSRRNTDIMHIAGGGFRFEGTTDFFDRVNTNNKFWSTLKGKFTLCLEIKLPDGIFHNTCEQIWGIFSGDDETSAFYFEGTGSSASVSLYTPLHREPAIKYLDGNLVSTLENNLADGNEVWKSLIIVNNVERVDFESPVVNLYFGQPVVVGSGAFNGCIRNVRLYNIDFSADDVSEYLSGATSDSQDRVFREDWSW